MTILLLALLLAVAALTPASAQQKRLLTIKPPPQYDVPYEGKLTIWQVSSQAQIWSEYCRDRDGVAVSKIACARKPKEPADGPRPWCEIYIAKDLNFGGGKVLPGGCAAPRTRALQRVGRGPPRRDKGADRRACDHAEAAGSRRGGSRPTRRSPASRPTGR